MADPEELTPDESWEEWKKDREKRKARLEATSLKAFQALPVEVTGDDKEPKPSAPTLPRPPPRLGSDLRPMTHPTTGEDIYMSEAAYDAYSGIHLKVCGPPRPTARTGRYRLRECIPRGSKSIPPQPRP